jgi:hypothetical protein
VSHRRTYASPVKTAIGKGTSFACECSKEQNFAGTQVSDWHKTDTTGTRFVLASLFVRARETGGESYLPES